MTRVRELTFAERSKWGECPVCKAPDGSACDSNVGIPLGRNVRGEIPEGGAHLGRLQKAPMRVREIPA